MLSWLLLPNEANAECETFFDHGSLKTDAGKDYRLALARPAPLSRRPGSALSGSTAFLPFHGQRRTIVCAMLSRRHPCEAITSRPVRRSLGTCLPAYENWLDILLHYRALTAGWHLMARDATMKHAQALFLPGWLLSSSVSNSGSGRSEE